MLKRKTFKGKLKNIDSLLSSTENTKNQTSELTSSEEEATATTIAENNIENAEKNTENAEKKIIINNLAVTLLDLEKSEPTLSNKTLKLNDESHKVITDFFIKHIIQTREGNRTRECQFATPEASMITRINAYTNNKSDESFIDFANKTTKYLFRIMKDSNTKSSGSFFILDTTIFDEDSIVLLKLDPKTGVQLNLETLDLNQVQNMLPDSNDKIHKCAIIKTQYVEDEINLIVVDKQQTQGEPSQFFMQGFLQAHALPNDSKKTIAALTECYEKVTQRFPNIDEKIINNAIDTEFNNNSQVYLPQSIENIYNSILPEDYEDRDTKIDEYKNTFIQEFQNKYADYGLSFKVERDEIKTTYTSKSKQIYFKYDKVLDDNEVTVKNDGDIYTITIINNDEIGFGKKIK